MANIMAFNEAKVPSHIRAIGVDNSDLLSGVGGTNFPVISIEGKVFSIKRKGAEPELVCDPGTKQPTRALQIVIIKAGAGGKSSQVFYEGKYAKGSDAKPTCYSNDGVAPAADAASPQSNKCAICAQNQWGSRITEDGRKAKACQASKRLAVAAPDLINDPMLLRVPTTSLVALAEYANYLGKRGVSYQSVVTEISFDWTVPHQLMTFKPVGFLDEATQSAVLESVDCDTVGYITGTVATALHQPDTEPFVPPKAIAPKPVAEAKSTPAVDDDDLPTTPPKANAAVEGAPAPKVKKPAKEDTAQSLDDALDAIEFDDL